MNEDLLNYNYSVYVNDTKINEGLMSQSLAEETAVQYTLAGFKNVLVVDETTAEPVECCR